MRGGGDAAVMSVQSHAERIQAMACVNLFLSHLLLCAGYAPCSAPARWRKEGCLTLIRCCRSHLPHALEAARGRGACVHGPSRALSHLRQLIVSLPR